MVVVVVVFWTDSFDCGWWWTTHTGSGCVLSLGRAGQLTRMQPERMGGRRRERERERERELYVGGNSEDDALPSSSVSSVRLSFVFFVYHRLSIPLLLPPLTDKLAGRASTSRTFTSTHMMIKTKKPEGHIQVTRYLHSSRRLLGIRKSAKFAAPWPFRRY